MNLKEEFSKALLDGYQRTGEEVGYWGHRFRQKVMRVGGLKTAKDMLLPRTIGQRAGLDALLLAKRPDLTLEAIILNGNKRRFRCLFTKAELEIAAERLGRYGK